MSGLQRTGDIKWMIALRILAGGPLAFFGFMHLIGAMPMGPILEAAGMPTALAIPASLAEFIAGVSLLAGLFARVGGLLAIGSMLGAVYAHMQIPSDGWPEANGGPQEPPLMFVAIGIIVLSAIIVWLGAGAFSVDRKMAGGGGAK